MLRSSEFRAWVSFLSSSISTGLTTGSTPYLGIDVTVIANYLAQRGPVHNN